MSEPGDGTMPVRVGLPRYGLAGPAFHAPLIATTAGMRLAGRHMASWLGLTPRESSSGERRRLICVVRPAESAEALA